MSLALGLVTWALAQSAPDARVLLGEIEAYDTQIGLLDGQLAALAATVDSAEADRLSKVKEADAAEAAIASRRDGARSLLRALYRIRRFGMFRLLFGADDPVELRRRAHYLRAVLAADEAHNAEFAKLAKEKRASAELAAKANADTERLRAQLAAQRESLDTERRRRKALLQDIRKKPAFAQQAAVETASARQSFDASVAAPATAPAAAGDGGGTAAFRALKGRLPRPVIGRLLRGFGSYVDPTTGQRSSNLGIDWAAAAGSPFRSVADGVVARAGYVRGYGQMVMVQHGAFATLYAHANGLRVTVDQRVRAGDVLGSVGTTGLTEEGEPRVHFEVRYNGTPQDPTEWLAP